MIVVADHDAAVGILGWEKWLDNPVVENYRFVTIAPVGGDTELALNQPHIVGREPGGDTGVPLNVADIEGTCWILVDKGVIFTKLLKAMPWEPGTTWLQDPDGNTVFFIDG